jgi:hypothetical protein
MHTSDPQIPLTTTLIITSFGPGSCGRGRSWISKALGPVITAALFVTKAGLARTSIIILEVTNKRREQRLAWKAKRGRVCTHGSKFHGSRAPPRPISRYASLSPSELEGNWPTGENSGKCGTADDTPNIHLPLIVLTTLLDSRRCRYLLTQEVFSVLLSACCRLPCCIVAKKAPVIKRHSQMSQDLVPVPFS